MTLSKKNKGRDKAPKSNGCPLWMMTFGDAMSLLVTFFVMLIAFSDPEEEKLSAAIGAMRGALGAIAFTDAIDKPEQTVSRNISAHNDIELNRISMGSESEATYLKAAELAEIIPKLSQMLGEKDDSIKADHVILQWVSEGLSIVLLTDPLFEKGRDTMKQDYSRLWNGIAKLLSGWDNEFRITGILYADHPVFIDNASTPFGLGLLRGQQVAHRLQNAMRASPIQFGIGAEVYSPLDESRPEEQIEIIISPANYLMDLGDEETWPAEVWR